MAAKSYNRRYNQHLMRCRRYKDVQARTQSIVPARRVMDDDIEDANDTDESSDDGQGERPR